jgi:ribosomal-protein-alanine N-acetyltransferase
MSLTCSPIFYSGTEDEQSALASLARQWEKVGFWSLGAVSEALATTGTELIYFCDARNKAHWLGACLFRSLGETADLLYIFVAPDSRRQGLADTLLDTMVARLRKLGVERLMLEVRPHNEAAIRLYESFGMQQIALRKKYYQNGDDALIFQLDLT